MSILHRRQGAAAGRQEEAGGGADMQGMHAPGSDPVSSTASVVGQCKLQAEVHERAQRGTPPPLTVEARSQSRVGLRAAVVIGQGDG